MAWVEKIGARSWRVRYPRTAGGYGSVAGFGTVTAARAYAADVDTDRRRGTWLDPAGGKTTLAAWVARWVTTVDVQRRTEENYRSLLRNHILPRWAHTPLGEITTLDVTVWFKDLRRRLAPATVASIRSLLSMILSDAVKQRLIPVTPVHPHRRRGRRVDHAPCRAERVFAMPEQVLRIAAQARTLGGPSAGLLIITAAWTGCRWGELTGLHRDHVDLQRGVLVIDPEYGALHESARQRWLGPPKTPASARTVSLPPFLVGLLREHLAHTTAGFVFTSRTGHPLWRSTFDRRVLRPAVDGDPRKGTLPVRAGLTFHGLRHSHKTWLIADGIPEIAQARRLGHHLTNRLTEVYSHVAPEIEQRLLHRLQHRYQHAHTRPCTRPPRRPTDTLAPHSGAVWSTTPRPRRSVSRTPPTSSTRNITIMGTGSRRLQNPSTQGHPDDHRPPREIIKKPRRAAIRPAPTERSTLVDHEWS
jgi:integrase